MAYFQSSYLITDLGQKNVQVKKKRVHIMVGTKEIPYFEQEVKYVPLC